MKKAKSLSDISELLEGSSASESSIEKAKTNAHAKAAAEYIHSVPGANLPKKRLVAFAKT